MRSRRRPHPRPTSRPATAAAWRCTSTRCCCSASARRRRRARRTSPSRRRRSSRSRRAWPAVSMAACASTSIPARWASPATARSRCATHRRSRCPTASPSTRRWRTRTATHVRCIARSRWPTSTRSGSRRSARSSRSSGSPAPGPAGGTSPAEAGSRSSPAAPRPGRRAQRICDNARPCTRSLRHVARLDQTPFPADILDLSHDGRGVARLDSGKTVFIGGALPGERVMARRTARSRSFDEAVTLEVLQASPDRVEPRCVHFGTCGGCALQHLQESKQILAKQRVLQENLERIGHVAPDAVLPPLTDAAWGYRRKGRFSVRRVEKKGKTLVGFRERDPRFVADLSECHTVIPRVGALIPPLSVLVDGLDARRDIPQIEFIAGGATDDHDGLALVFRHLQPLSEGDRAALLAFAQAQGLALFLQPGGVDSVHPLWPADPQLSFRLPAWDVELKFRPLDFIQVNAGLNEKMIARALELLDVQPGERVLDLFCGLGNFTLPLASGAAEVIGVEDELGLVVRALANVA